MLWVREERMRKEFPKNSIDWATIEKQMDAMSENDIKWRDGRSPVFVFGSTPEVYEVKLNAFVKFFTENGLGGARAFAGIGQMEREIIEMGLDLFHAPENGAGSMSTGGTESILLAVKCCRDWSRANRKNITKPNIVGGLSIHPAFDKAASLMDLEVRRTELGPDYRTNPDAVEAAIDDQTILVVGSAPCFPHGVIDPIEQLSDLCMRKNIWLHVDACVGGYIAPFAKKLGYDVPRFDFELPGVRSMSADLHKFGHAAKPASTVFYRDADYHQYQKFDHGEWSGARLITQTFVGTRPGGAIAAAWAVMHFLGEEGYLAITDRIMKMAKNYIEGINAIDGLEVVSNPNLSIITYQIVDPELDLATIAEAMRKHGWLMSMTRQPQSVLLMMSLLHEPVREEYLENLRAAVAESRGAISSNQQQPTYS
jgi:sphinganine-1-phosphate aldolase